ncbi:unnamed protein product [Parnassius apollo]|uniref:(apollo) hypothetical protein n=1 Tax=Parnassius apollo TaxID=110799 RepID=A0A8S3XIG9_PARAO|nr:unnamed protein product [Parnassius apollo]
MDSSKSDYFQYKAAQLSNKGNILKSVNSQEQGSNQEIESGFSSRSCNNKDLTNIPSTSFAPSSHLDNLENVPAYQLECGNESDPTIKEFLLFLEKRALALEKAEPTTTTKTHYKPVVNVTTPAALSCAYCITDNEEPDTESLYLNAENHTTNENENLHREKIIAIDEMFAKALEYFANTNPTERQFIPKQRSSKKLSKIVAYVNNILLPQYINSEIEFKTFQNLVYCAAWTSAKLNGAKIEIAIQVDNPLGPEKQKKYNKPKWEQRLENKKRSAVSVAPTKEVRRDELDHWPLVRGSL